MLWKFLKGYTIINTLLNDGEAIDTLSDKIVKYKM